MINCDIFHSIEFLYSLWNNNNEQTLFSIINQNTLLCHLREVKFLLNDIKNKDFLDIIVNMTSYKCSINSLNKNLQQLILFPNNHYPRIMTNAGKYFMWAFRMRDLLSLWRFKYWIHHKWHCWIQLGPSSVPRSESSKACF